MYGNNDFREGSERSGEIERACDEFTTNMIAMFLDALCEYFYFLFLFLFFYFFLFRMDFYSENN